MPCRNYAANGHCSRRSCDYAHETTNLLRLVKLLEAATTSVDLCIFTLTCNELANALEEAHQKRKIRVRIVADSEQAGSQGADVARLAQKGREARLSVCVCVCVCVCACVRACFLACSQTTSAAATTTRESQLLPVF